MLFALACALVVMAEGLVAAGRCYLDPVAANAAWRTEQFPRLMQQGSCTYMASAAPGASADSFVVSYASMSEACPGINAQLVPLSLPACDQLTFRQSAWDLTLQEGLLVSGAVCSVLVAAWAVRVVRLALGRSEVLD